MNSEKQVGFIECTGKSLLDNRMQLDGFKLKKYLSRTSEAKLRVKRNYPDTEIVENPEAILNDSEIDLVLISKPQQQDLQLVAEAVRAGKSVRIL